MINAKNIQPGTLVFTALRGLKPRHASLFEVEKNTIVKRTATGYKIEQRYAHNGAYLMKDDQYYISTDRDEVARALKADLAACILETKVQLEKLEYANTMLNAGVSNDY